MLTPAIVAAQACHHSSEAEAALHPAVDEQGGVSWRHNHVHHSAALKEGHTAIGHNPKAKQKQVKFYPFSAAMLFFRDAIDTHTKAEEIHEENSYLG
jgi:hypothetical protein